MPIATAMRFFSTPPNSVPMTSVLTKVRKYALRARRATASAVSWLVDEMTAAVGCSRAISSARFGPGGHRDARGIAVQLLLDHLAHPQAGAPLDALHERDDRRVGARDERPHRLEVLADGLARDRQVHLLGAVERLGEVVRRGHLARQVDPGQVLAVALGLLDLVRELGATRPHRHVRAAVGEDLAERRAPAARADDGDARAGRNPVYGSRRPVSFCPCSAGIPPLAGGRSRRAAATSSAEMSAMTTSVAAISVRRLGRRAAERRRSTGSPKMTRTRRRSGHSLSLP